MCTSIPRVNMHNFFLSIYTDNHAGDDGGVMYVSRAGSQVSLIYNDHHGWQSS